MLICTWSSLCDWFRKLASSSQPIRCKPKPITTFIGNWRFSALWAFCLFSLSSHWWHLSFCYWPLWLLLFWLNDTWLKCALRQNSVCKSLVRWPSYPGSTTRRWRWQTERPRISYFPERIANMRAYPQFESCAWSTLPDGNFCSKEWPISKFSS